MKHIAAAATLALTCTAPVTAQACSAETPCEVADGEYYIALPESVAGAPMPALVYLHGFGGTGAGVFGNRGLVDAVLARGYAFVAPAGMMMEGRNGASWSFHPNLPQRRDEISFLHDVRDDLVETHGIDADKIVLTGFSIGGSMTSYLACAAPESFSAYMPLGGSFWRPHPGGCEGDVRLLHTHGWTDGTVPLEGRVLRGSDIRDVGALAQGDVFHAMDIWRVTNDCVHLKADRFETSGFYWRRALGQMPARLRA
ncbi:alpha/beta hydrolase family esterase [Roseobacteraceae bacterium S113]